MRRLKFAASFALGCVFLFAGMAPVDHDPYSGTVAPQARGTVQPEDNAWPIDSRWPIDSAWPIDNVDSAMPEEPTADVPASEPGEPRKPTALERAKAALAQSSAEALSNEELCSTLLEVARGSDLPLGFFTNLIWRESRFDREAISPAGAMGIAQFMPDVADKFRLDAFDSRSALPASARLLRSLRARFGNLGLAAAAYNAGPKRVADWLEGRSSLPKETQDYVQIITGRPAAHWQSVKPHTAVYRVPARVPCHRLSTFASVEHAERAQQEQALAEEIRIAEQKAREAARRMAEERAKQRKTRTAAHSARLKIAARVQADKAKPARHQPPMRLAQVKR